MLRGPGDRKRPWDTKGKRRVPVRHRGRRRQRCKEARRYKFQLLSALAVGAALAVAAVCGGPWLASVTSGLGGFGSTLGMHAGLWWRRLCRTSTA